MKKRLKRITSLLLSAMIAATSAAYAPPVSGSQGFMPYVALEMPENMATPSEAVKATPSEAENATPSDAVPDEEISAPSQAEKTFVRVDPEEEEIPEYYSRISKTGKKLWKFEDRNGSVQYRDYGYILGEAEFPLWYSLIVDGDLDTGDTSQYSSGVDLDDEYWTLAPYLFKSVKPTDESWKELESRICTEDALEAQNKEELSGLKNWDQTEYSIYHLTAKEPTGELEESTEKIEDLGYFFYGSIPNAEDFGTCWWYADESGSVLTVVESTSKLKMVNLLAASYLPSITFASMRVIDGDVKVNDYTNAPGTNDTEDTSITLWTPPSWSGYTFLGWSSLDNYQYPWYVAGHENVLTAPQNYDFLIHGGLFYKPGAKITRGNVSAGVNSLLYGMWRPNNTYSLRLVKTSEGETYNNSFGSSASSTQYIIVKEPGVEIDLTQYDEPSKDGYVFSGWYTGKNATGTKYTSINLSSDTVLYPGFTANQNTVKFFDADGNVLSEQIVPSGNSAVAPTPPTIAGKVFAGWNKDFSNVLSDLDITAQYKSTATLNIVGNGGTVYGGEQYSTELVLNASLASTLSTIQSNLARDGYRFTSWYYFDENGVQKSGYPSNITGNITLYASWAIMSYGNKFYYRLDYALYYNVATTYMDYVKLPETDPPKIDGYIFDGWYTAQSGGEKLEGNTVVQGSAAKVYYAHYKEDNVNITFDFNIPGETHIKTMSVLRKSVYLSSLDIGTVTRPFYFNGNWVDSTGKVYLYISDIVGDSITLYRAWSGWDTYVRFYNNTGSQYESQAYVYTVKYGKPIKSYNPELPTGVNGSKIFIGWYTEKTGGNKITPETIVENGDTFNTITQMSGYSYGEVRVYAHYANASNTVTFKDWNGTVLDTQEVAYGADATPPQVPERSGYTFIGWNTPYTNIQEATVITAQYSRNTYKLTLDGNGGDLNGAATRTQEFSYGESIDQTLADGSAEASQEYFAFNGWYTEAGGGSKYSETGNTMPETDMTVYAHWVRSSSEVIYKDFDGTILERQEVAIGADATPPQVPERSGYTFTGWDTPSTNIQDHVIITAQYTINSYHLLLDGNGGKFDGDATKTLTLEYGQLFDQALADGSAAASQKYFTFVGWYTAPVGGSKYAASGNVMPASDVTIYAHWNRTSNEVVYKDWNGTIIDRQEVEIGEDATPPADPSRPGYTFTGWNKPSTNIQEDTVITALYSKDSYTVKFVDYNDVLLKSENVGYGDSAAPPADPSRTGYHFESWDGAYTNIKSNITVKAKYSPILYWIYYYGNGETSGNMAFSIFEYDEPGKHLIVNTFEKTGYIFTGWNTKPDGSGDSYSDEQVIFNETSVAATVINLYAQWEKSAGVVRFLNHDGTLLKEQTVTLGSDATPPIVPERIGYTFTGWDKSFTNIQEDMEITAQYSIKNYQLRLNGNGGTLEGEATKNHTLTYSQLFDQILTDGATEASHKYYTFAGWYTDPVGGSKYSESGNTMPASDVTVYAHWSRSSNEAVYKDWNGNVLKTQEVAIGADATPPADPVRPGYTFTGWDKPSTNIQEDTVITAQYSINSYQLTLEGNGGTINGKATEKQMLAYGESIDQILVNGTAEANRKYYTFDGWYTDPTGGSKYTVSGNTMPATDMTVYAHWMRSSNEVVYKDWNGNVLKTQEVAVGADATPPTDPTRSGYTFTGWDKPSVNIQEDTVITAQYSINNYQLTLNGNGGTLAGDATKNQVLTYGESIDQALAGGAAEASRKYYTFVGWYTDPTGGSKYTVNGNTMPATNVTVYAHWMRSSNEVVYKDWNGNVLKTQEVAIGADATPPADPTRTGYTFTGWDKTSTNIQDHTTITAQYTANGFILTLNGNGGTLAGDTTKNQVLAYGESIDQALVNGAAEVSRKYYIFDGWYTAPTGGSKYTESGNAMPATDVMVYAHWSRSSSEVIYKDWDGKELKTQEVSIGADATPPADPARPGYTFTGWDKPSTNIQNHTTITAQYTANDFILTLNGNGGTLAGDATKNQVLTYGESSIDQALADGAAEASRKYYTFAGWYSAPTGGSKYAESGNTMPATNVTVYAQWSRSSNEVVYKDWNGNVLKTQEVAIGADATPPADPVRPGYTFTGWDKPSANIQEDTVITAKYSINNYQLILNGNGGTLAGDATKNQVLTYGESFDQVLVDGAAEVNRKYYTFDGWYTEPIGGSKYTEIGNTMPASNVTVYAHWMRSSSEVIYKDWNENVLKTQEVAIGTDATPPADPVRLGYTFMGWDKPSTNIQDHTTITALYAANGFILTLNGNRGVLAGDTTKNQVLADGESIDQALADGAAEASRKYYTFDGWYTAPTGGSEYAESGNTMPASDVTVYAHWIRSSSEVIYKDWNGNILKSQEVAIGADATPPADPTRLGYTFTGWGMPSTNIQDHITITAQYTANGFMLTLNGNGGTLAGDATKNQVLAYGESIDQALTDGAAEANRKYYTFDGWYTAPTGGSKYAESGNTMPDSSVTVYAHWMRSTSEVIYKDWNGDILKTQEVAIGADATPPADPVRPEYTFTGWDKPSTNIQDHTTITALYTISEYKQPTEENNDVAPVLVPPVIDTTVKPTVPDTGGTFTVNPENPYDVTYTKPDGTPAKDEWVGDGNDWYHVDEDGKLNYDWYLEGEKTWYKLNKETGDRFGAALIGWNNEPMDDKRYFFDPATTKMLTGWQNIDGKWYYFTRQNEAQTYFGNNRVGWKYDPTKPGKPYGSMYQSEDTPDGYKVDENGVWIN